MIKMETIIREGHETLRKIAEEVKFPLSEEDKSTMEEMLEYLKNSQDPIKAEKYGLRPGVGLAAPQINVSKRMITIYVQGDAEEGEKDVVYCLFNPKIVSHSEQEIYLENGEGCLSVDRPTENYVRRYARITVEAQDHEGKKIKIRVRGYLSIVFQHEIDHLNGILFLDRLTNNIENCKPI